MAGLKRIPRIKFPPRHKPDLMSHPQTASVVGSETQQKNVSVSKSDVPAPPSNTGVGGKASLQPKRTPVSDREIEAILLGGCF